MRNNALICIRFLVQTSALLFSLSADKIFAEVPLCPSGTQSRGKPPPEGHFVDCGYRDGSGRFVQQGPTRSWYPGSRQLRSEIDYRNGVIEGRWRKWDVSGNLLEDTPYKNGLRHGTRVAYWPNGAQSDEATYLDGKLHGTWKKWNIDGQALRETFYEFGRYMRTQRPVAARAVQTRLPVEPVMMEPVPILVPTPALVTGVELSSEELALLAKKTAFRVLVSTNVNSPKQSYGTGFRVGAAGWIVTNYHVIQSAVVHSSDYRVYVENGDTKELATVLYFDLVDDLAVLSLPSQTGSSLLLADVEPVAGAKLYPVGIPEDLNFSIVEGTFNGALVEGAFSRFQLSSALNHGMSGGPILNSRGQIVGANVAMVVGGQNISFGVPLERVRAVLAHASQMAPRDLSHFLLQQQMDAERRILQGWENLATTVLANWRIGLAPKSIQRCWHDQGTSETYLVKLETTRCRSLFTAPLDREIEIGAISTEVSSITVDHSASTEKKSSMTTQLLQLASDSIPYSVARIMGDRFFEAFVTSEDPKELQKKEATCKNAIVKNRNGIVLNISFCSKKQSARNHGLVDGIWRATSLLSPKGRHLASENSESVLNLMTTVKGWSMTSIQKLMERQLESVSQK